MRMRKLIAVMLVLGMMLTWGNFSAGMAFAYEMKDGSVALDIETSGLQDSGPIRVIVELEDQPAIEYATEKGVHYSQMSVDDAEDITENILAEQESIKTEIEAVVGQDGIEYHHQFVSVVNGFSATTTAADIAAIEQLPGVKQVIIAERTKLPEVEMITSKDGIMAKETWDLSYKGEGQVVAIIDSGIDPTHQDMILTDPGKAKFNETEMNALIAAEGLPGRWYSAKVPYGYNYADDNDEIRDLGATYMHGMHVAGTVGANGDEAKGGIKGVAPEVQLLAMKVGSNDPLFPWIYTDTIVKAIDDSVKLGADAINISLGSPAVFVNPDDPCVQAVQRAADNGIVIAVSAGNSDRFGKYWEKKPYAANPDIGVVNATRGVNHSISVAAAEKTTIVASEAAYCDDEGQEGKIHYVAGDVDPAAVFGEVPVQYVDCGNLAGKELGGKLLIVQFGMDYVGDLVVEDLLAQNLAGVILYYSEDDGDHLKPIDLALDIPVLTMSRLDALQLIGLPNGTIRFKGDDLKQNVVIQNPSQGNMSSFTSWGTTPSLDFMPEITGPGSEIYSTLNDNQYGMMSGTSMASPHIAGGAALALERVEKELSSLTGRDKMTFAKNLLMSTARPLVDDSVSENIEVSPRHQGAGMMDLLAATTTPAIVTSAATGLSKVNLREISDETTFTINVQNFSDQAVTYHLSGTVETDWIKDGFNQGKPQSVLKDGAFPITFAQTEVTVPAKGDVDVAVSVDLDQAVTAYDNQLLADVFANGTFIEGFVKLVSTDAQVPQLIIPYMGFYGEWDQAPIIDASIYDPEEEPYYGGVSMVWYDQVTGWFFSLGYDPVNDEFDGNHITFSPNGDGQADYIWPWLSFLRNAKEMDSDILDSEGNKLLDVTSNENIRKNYYGTNQYKLYNSWLWDGKIHNDVVDGDYIYQIKVRIDDPEAAWQTYQFPISVDTVAPVIEAAHYDPEMDTLTVTANDGEDAIRNYELWDRNEKLLDSGDGVFNLTELDDDVYSVTVKAYDWGLNTVESEEIVVGEDHDVPAVHLDLPRAGVIYGAGEIEVAGYVADASGLKQLAVNGEVIEFTYNEQSGVYFFTTTVNYEADGDYEIDITAADEADHEVSFKRRFSVDMTVPLIQMAQEPVRIVAQNVEAVSIVGIIEETFSGLRVKVNGSEVCNENGAVTYDLNTSVPLKYGDNLICIEAEDGEGHKTVQTYQVYRQQDGDFTRWDNEPQVAPDHDFHIRFNAPVDPESVNAVNIFVVNEAFELIHHDIYVHSYQQDQIVLEAPEAGYAPGEYTLYIKGIMSETGKRLADGIEMRFRVNS